MAGIKINPEICTKCEVCIGRCPFQALEVKDEKVVVLQGCKACKVCINLCPHKAISFEEVKHQTIDKDRYKGILVYVEHEDGVIHGVTYELINKALELAKKVNQSVSCLFIGSEIYDKADALLEYGVSHVYVYESEALQYFKVDSYTNVFEHCIHKSMPHTVLIGATTVGRSLAPKVATRFKTGLTADCTILDIKENTDLIQTRPAFGGNIMAQIVTENHRPQFSTVRYKVMDHAKKIDNPSGVKERVEIDESLLKSKIEIIEVIEKLKEIDISEAEVLVVAGNAVSDEKGMALVQSLADALSAQVAVTRPLVEKGWMTYQYQIGLSGRTVKPKLIITCGVSGAIQFVAGMENSEVIMAINIDENAPIFNIADYAVVGDVYEVLPSLIEKIKGEKFNVS